MIITKKHVDDFIKCQFLFGKNTMYNKYQQNELPEEYLRIRKHLGEIASYEMKNCCKLSLSEYRIKFTNKYFTSKKHLMNMDSITTMLNSIFEPFAGSAFIGYSIPIEIPIEGTTIIYRNMVDFGLIDSEGNLTFIDIEEIQDINYSKKVMKNWSHYYSIYSYLANSFKKTINVIVMDPIKHQRIDLVFRPDRWAADYKLLVNEIKPIENPSFVKNYFSCSGCLLMGDNC